MLEKDRAFERFDFEHFGSDAKMAIQSLIYHRILVLMLFLLFIHVIKKSFHNVNKLAMAESEIPAFLLFINTYKNYSLQVFIIRMQPISVVCNSTA